MIAEILRRFEIVEECYEFMLGYAARGLPSDDSSPQVRELLRRAVAALQSLPQDCAAVVETPAFLQVLEGDTADSLAALELVLAQPVISSQLVDNLNASIHLRALLTDLFLLGDVLRNSLIAATY